MARKGAIVRLSSEGSLRMDIGMRLSSYPMYRKANSKTPKAFRSVRRWGFESSPINRNL